MTGRISENTRQEYLDAMGIQTWFPRSALPNALPPREFELPEPVASTPLPMTQSPAEALQKISQPQPVDSAAARKSLLQSADLPETPSVEKAKDKPEPPPVIATPEKPKGPVSQFRLVTLSPSDECLVIVEMPHTGINQFTRFHQRLLDDILRALNLKTGTPATQSSISEFVWPMGSQGLMGQFSQDDTAAADAVCAYLSNQFGLARRKVVLLLGRAAARFVIDPARTFSELRGLQTGLHSEQWFAASHSLNEMMKLPHLKAETWSDLSPLRDRLQESDRE